MTLIKHPFAVISVFCQTGFFFGAILVGFEVYDYSTGWGPHVEMDPRVVSKFVNQKFFDFGIFFVGGLLGVLLCWFSLTPFAERPEWFLNITKLLAVLWIVVLPIGPVVTFLMFNWRKSADEANAAI